MGSRALPITHDGREDDRTIDLSTLATFGCRVRGLQDAPQVRRYHRCCARVLRGPLLQAPEIARNIGSEPRNVDVTCSQNQSGILVFTQRQQHVLQRHAGVGLGARILGSARERLLEV